MPQTRVSRVPDPIGVEGKDEATQASPSNPVPTEDQVAKDWDESDRAKVNPIVGQAGIDGGSGAISAKTVRTAKATDDIGSTRSNPGYADVRYTTEVDPNNQTVAAGVTLDAYIGAKFLDEDDLASHVGSALPAAPTDTFLAGDWTELGNASGFGLDAFSTRLGQGYAIFSRDSGATVSRIETIPFAGQGGFISAPHGSTHYKIAFQNRDATGTCLFRLHSLIHNQPQSLFQFPIAAPIDGSLPATLVRSVSVGQQPDGDYVNEQASGSDPNNSTTTPLGAAGVYTGTAFDATGFVAVLVVVKSDQPSATDGLVFQFSNDGFVTVDDYPFTYGAADVGQQRIFSGPANVGEEFRIKYTNGATPQATFSLRVEFVTSATQPISLPIETPLSAGLSARITRSIIAGALDDGSGDYDNAQVHRDALGTSQIVAPGHRLSQTFGRTAVTVQDEAVTADTNLRTNTAGKTFYCVGYSWALTNSSTANVARVIIRDGIGGDVRIPIKVQEGTLGAEFTANGSGSFPDEGLPFATGVYVDVITGTVSLDIILHGYEEDN